MSNRQAKQKIKKSGFFAYPDEKPLIAGAINEAVERFKSFGLELTPWPSMKIIGFKIDDLIREEIYKTDVLIADITYPNMNVFYEIGYAIAVGKPVIPTLNVAIERSAQGVQKIGLFDNIGWVQYNNAEELTTQLSQWEERAWTAKYLRQKDHAQPLFILDSLKKTDFRNHIFHAVDNSEVKYRTFDPSEVPRLTAVQALSEISSSAGVIVPIISDEIVDSYIHNLRAGLIIGLCHGFEIEPLAIQYGNGPAPVDYRDFITNSTFRHETEKHVADYCSQTLVWNQKDSARERHKEVGLLSQINLGSPTAENETQQLHCYFLKTAEFSRALRAEGAVIAGRKGSGKSAIYFQVSETVSKDKRNCVVDLRPASHNLSEMREALLSVVNVGVFEHTIAAFWQYIIYFEILLKIREKVLPKSRNDYDLQVRIREIEENFQLNESMVSGDFTSRLDTAVKEVIYNVGKISNADDLKSHITNIMFERPIPGLRDAIISFNDFFDRIHILIDDLDKGWPPRQVEDHDVATIKHLIEGLNRIQRDLTKRETDFRHLVFLRSDIYEHLVEQTSDRGKYNIIKVDWSDPEQLFHMLRQRVVNTIDSSNHDAAWDAVNPKMPSGQHAVDLMIESSLRRPRFLIDLCERTLSFAINRGHTFVTVEDVEEGMRQMSLYLVSDFGYEMRDICGMPENIFYHFIGKSDLLTAGELEEILSSDELRLGVTETIDLLLWYGFLGVVNFNDKSIYIYDCAYDIRRLEAERSSIKGEVLYSVNPAFLRGIKR